jgi:hypothetical protein
MLAEAHHLIMSLQDEAMRDPLAGPAGTGGPNGAAAGEERHNGGGGGGWMSDSRWSGLRKRGESAGWLVDPSQVTCQLQSQTLVAHFSVRC